MAWDKIFIPITYQVPFIGGEDGRIHTLPGGTIVHCVEITPAIEDQLHSRGWRKEVPDGRG